MVESSVVCQRITELLQKPSSDDDSYDQTVKVTVPSKQFLAIQTNAEHNAYELKIAQMETPLVLFKNGLT